MARRKPKTNRQARKIRRELLVLGVTCLLPAAMRDSAIGAAFAGLPALGTAHCGGSCPCADSRARTGVVDTARRLPYIQLRRRFIANSIAVIPGRAGAHRAVRQMRQPSRHLWPKSNKRPRRWSEAVFDMIESGVALKRWSDGLGRLVCHARGRPGADGGVDDGCTPVALWTPWARYGLRHWQAAIGSTDENSKGVMAALNRNRGISA